ncbi:MAG TPA: type II CRISPR RNA-guided endonuclease Cas9 [Syntrophomonadaceae bacterium]|nr:type II CRISPR RNA-guided endonuclease Cas9 [Syntrophomonadaceae bacterium]
MNYRLGLDIGITSVGWAVLEHNEEEEPVKIVDLGVRIFDRAENPKDGSSLARPRREARSARRRIRRHRHRIERIKRLLEDYRVISLAELESLYHSSQSLTDIYELRYYGLERRLSNQEWARVLIHLAQRRGFKSNRKKENEKEEGKLLAAVKSNQDIMHDKGYRTVGEMFYLDPKFALHKRNKADDYSHTIGRQQVLDEISLLFARQRELGNPHTTIEFENVYKDIVSGQRSFDLGPGDPSPYAGNQIEKMRGNCTFEKDCPRAAKACYSFELFNLYQKINSLRIESAQETSRFLTAEERELIVQLAHQKADLNYSTIRNILELRDEQWFNNLTYGLDNTKETEKKSKFNYLKSYHQIRKAMDSVSKGRIQQFTVSQLDLLGETLTLYKNEGSISRILSEAGFSKQDIDAVLSLNFRGFSHLSLKAIRNILPWLEKGQVYSEAATSAGYNFRGHDSQPQKYLPLKNEQLDNITNPVVRRAVSQSIKIINAIIRKYGSPQLICIELSREMGKSFDERKVIEKQIKENNALNEQVRQKIIEFGHSNPSGQDIVKMKLWQEQDGRCAYSGDPIPIERLFEPGVADVDHIVPYSISFDDSYANKVLVRSSENRQKGNLLPYEYMKNDPVKLERFIVWVNTSVKNYHKKQRLLKKSITDEDRNKWNERPLNDTKYISRFMLNYIRNNLQFAPAEYLGKRRVITVNGSITAFLRKMWGLKKERLAGDLHHAQDAVVVACVSESMIQKITRYYQYYETRYSSNHFVDRETGEIINARQEKFGIKFVEPWEGFRFELESRLSDDPVFRIKAYNLKNYLNPDEVKPVFVSRMPTRKNRGLANEATIRSPRLVEEGFFISKVNITDLILNANGEIKGYYQPQSDLRLYEALKSRLREFNGDGKKAFKEPFYKPTKTGKLGPLVKKVKVIEKSNLNVLVGSGIAANGDMIRIDVFKTEEGYFWVPIYVADTVKKTLPNKAALQSKPYELWPEMSDDDFIFSLYPNDLIRFQREKDKDEFMYYKKAGISTASITVESHDRSYSIPSLGVKTLLLLEKWEVDVLGNRYRVKKERRQYFPGQVR